MPLSPRILLYDAAGNLLAVGDGVSIPAGTEGLLAYGSDAGTARRFIVDSAGRQLVAGAAAANAALAGSPVRVAGSDGSLTRDLLTDTLGRPVVVGPGAAGAPNGGVQSVQVPDTTSSGGMGALNAVVGVLLAGTSGAAMQLAAGTLIGTIVPELTVDAGATWVGTYFDDPTTGLKTTSLVFSGANTAQTRSIVCVDGASSVRVRTSVFTSGNATASLRASAISAPAVMFEGPAGGASPPGTAQIGGVDISGLLRALLTSSRGVPAISQLPASIVQGDVPTASAGTLIGWVQTSATTEVAVRSTTYTEQAAIGQRSLNSTNAADAAAGTGARTVRITYYAQTGTGALTGPFTEVVTMNGVTGVNTVATDIRYIEKIEVVTVGSTGKTFGAIQIWTGLAATGAVFASLGAVRLLVGYSAHYVPSGKTCYIASMIVSSTAGSGNNSLFALRAADLGAANTAEQVLQDNLRSVGQGAGTQFTFPVPSRVVGPARIVAYVTPVNGVSQLNEATFAYYEL